MTGWWGAIGTYIRVTVSVCACACVCVSKAAAIIEVLNLNRVEWGEGMVAFQNTAKWYIMQKQEPDKNFVSLNKAQFEVYKKKHKNSKQFWCCMGVFVSFSTKLLEEFLIMSPAVEVFREINNHWLALQTPNMRSPETECVYLLLP